VAGKGRIAMIKDTPADNLHDLIVYFHDMDLVLCEGYKRADAPKIEICRAERSREAICIEDPDLVALVTDTDLAPPGVPRFDPEAVGPLAEFIERNYLHRPLLKVRSR